MIRLPPSPDITWTPEGAPRAAAHDDVYFSKAGGLAEAEAVFLAGTGLPKAWENRDRFSLCELGFGTGLNILAAWRAWKKTRSPHAVLHISSIEACPLERDDAARALAAFPEISDLTEKLLARWPARAFGPQRLWFPEDGFALTLWTGDAEAVLSAMNGAFDAWFWDGFAPARNESMWGEGIVREIARLSAPGARLASFTVAGHVRRALEGAGFAVAKRPGFGAKRERLEAVFEDAPASSASIYPYAAHHPRRVAIVGAGIAGAACAQALARRGVETVVLDAAAALGAGASGNPVGLVMPRLDRGEGPLSELFLASYLAAVAAYEELSVFNARGVEQRAGAKDGVALEDLLNDPPLPEDWFSRTAHGALHARAGVVSPQAAVAKMLQGARLMLEAPVHAIEQAEDGAWVLRAPDDRAMLKADAIVLACGAALTAFAPARFLPIALSRGQIEWGEGASPAHAITSGSYVAPFGGGVLFGATFDKVDAAEGGEASAVSRAQNIAALAALAPDIAASLKPETLRSRASYRATTPDRAPVAGLLPDAEAWLAQYSDIAHGRAPDTQAQPPAHRGIYVIGGLGARGLTFAPLLGERIASEMFGEPQLLSTRALEAIHPARFLHRSLKRR
ncbi:MAG: bifunctional tRNA (5-methylaminomethyl-2-thiouridine)(34)-methyltransferase MnmD/FAD-dependent 5-carboxymethylaminomethyl-2-thiouridine(34) oxidoreductase MnmC [Caulobacterales bacterium]|nr:bifunctional tRNA (5-methylaminomethyl-2-thiouridine)(34)-methyltransferase MnmD/FAD-dependent 5-carboxymethylaminomethyl-2-thiouridine(34) oxidoreductase MnmC [Caulobacterales bacterium]